MVITETKIDAQTTSPSISISGYILNRNDRTNHGGGVATYIADNLVSETLTSYQEDATKAGLEVTINRIRRPAGERALIVVGVYRPPSARAEWFEDFSDLLLQLLPLGGSTNCRTDRTEPYGAVRSRTGPYGAVQSRSGPYGTVRNRTDPGETYGAMGRGSDPY